MSTSLLYHAFNIQGARYLKTEYSKNTVTFEVELRENQIRCAECKSVKVIKKGSKERVLANGKIGRKDSFIKFKQHRLKCKSCGVSKEMPVSFSDKWSRHTHAMKNQILDLCKKLTIEDVSAYLNVDWRTVKDICKSYLNGKYGRPPLNMVRHIAIDEICIGKGHKYKTLVMDLETGRVLYIADGKSGESLRPFWKKLNKSGANVKSVAIDMSPAYISAVSDYLPDAEIVFDHFHVIKLFNEKLSDFRRKQYNLVTELGHKKVLKGTRWLILKNQECLENDSKAKAKLDEALSINQPLATAYYLKEELRLIWKQKTRKEAGKFLTEWAKKSAVSGIQWLIKFGHKLLANKNQILSFYSNRYSTGPLEATNNKIKTIIKQAYGFHDHSFFKLKVFACHDMSYRLT